MSDDFTFGNFYCRCRKNKVGGGYTAWAAKTPQLGANPFEVPFSEDCWFESGFTKESAIEALKVDLRKNTMQ